MVADQSILQFDSPFFVGPRNEKVPGICRAHGRIAEAILAGVFGGDGQALLGVDARSRAVFD